MEFGREFVQLRGYIFGADVSIVFEFLHLFSANLRNHSITDSRRRNNKLHSADPCYVSPIATNFGPIVRFPSLSQDLQLAKCNESKNIALSSRFTPYEWTQMNLRHYNESDTNRNHAEKLRSEAVRALRYDCRGRGKEIFSSFFITFNRAAKIGRPKRKHFRANKIRADE